MSALSISSLTALAAAEREAVDRLVADGALTPESATIVAEGDELLLHGATKQNIARKTARGYYVNQARYALRKAAQRGWVPRKGVLLGVVISAAIVLAVMVLLFARNGG